MSIRKILNLTSMAIVCSICSGYLVAKDVNNKKSVKQEKKSEEVKSKKHKSTLFDAFESAIQHNKEILSAQDELKALHENYVSALASFRPTAQAHAQYQPSHRDEWSNNSALKDSSERKWSTNSRSRSYGVAVKQNLFKGFSDIAALKEVDASIKARWKSFEAVKQKVLRDVAITYFAILAKHEEIQHLKALQESRKESIEVAKEMHAAGTAKYLDVAQAEASYSETLSNLARADAEFEAYMAEFEELVGTKIDVRESDDLQLYDESLTLEQQLDLAQKHNPSVLAAVETLQAAKAAVKKVNVEFTPTVDLTYSFDQSYDPSSKKRSEFDKKLNQKSHTLGIGVSVPIYDGGVSRSEKRKAIEMASKSAVDLEKAKADVVSQVKATSAALLAAKKKIDAATEAVKARALALSDTLLEYNAGTKIMNDVLEAQQQLFQAKFMLIQAKNEYYTNQCKANALMGRMDAKYLQIQDGSFNYEQHFMQTRRKF